MRNRPGAVASGTESALDAVPIRRSDEHPAVWVPRHGTPKLAAGATRRSQRCRQGAVIGRCWFHRLVDSATGRCRMEITVAPMMNEEPSCRRGTVAAVGISDSRCAQCVEPQAVRPVHGELLTPKSASGRARTFRGYRTRGVALAMRSPSPGREGGVRQAAGTRWNVGTGCLGGPRPDATAGQRHDLRRGVADGAVLSGTASSTTVPGVTGRARVGGRTMRRDGEPTGTRVGRPGAVAAGGTPCSGSGGATSPAETNTFHGKRRRRLCRAS